MKVTSNGKINRVYGALMGQKIGTKVEIFSAFEFYNQSETSDKINLDISYIDTRRDLANQLFPKLDIVGFFSTNKTKNPNDKDKEIVHTMQYFGVINPIYLVLSTEIEKENELPISAFEFDKNLKQFNEINHIIEGWESERICLETVTKATDFQSNLNSLNQNLQTTKNALNVLKENLTLIQNNINKLEKDQKFKEMLEDLIINYPSVENSDYNDVVNQKEKEIEILNCICSGMVENSYLGRTQALQYLDPLSEKKIKNFY